MSAPCFIECIRTSTLDRVFINVDDIATIEPEIVGGESRTCIYLRSEHRELRVLEGYDDVIRKIADAAKFDPRVDMIITALDNIEGNLRYRGHA